MKRGEWVLNVCFGLSLIFWAIAGVWGNMAELGHSPVRMCIAVLNLSVGILILSRKAVIKPGSRLSVIISLPSLICGAFIFKLSGPLHEWLVYAEVTFILGALVTFLSFLFLGKNFSILPAKRQLVTKGTYQLIRHPAYLGESIMVVACVMGSQKLVSWLLVIVFVPALMYRIKEEEALLLEDKCYREYSKNVRWRLIPYVW